MKDCDIGYSWNVNNCRCEMKKLAALIESESESERFPKRFCKYEECDIETSEKIKDTKNKTVILIKKVKNCKPFVGVSILFLGVTITLIGIMIYFCLKSENNALSY